MAAILVEHVVHRLYSLVPFKVKKGRIIGQRLHQPFIVRRGRHNQVSPPLMRDLMRRDDIGKECARVSSLVVHRAPAWIEISERGEIDQSRKSLAKRAGNWRDDQRF